MRIQSIASFALLALSACGGGGSLGDSNGGDGPATKPDDGLVVTNANENQSAKNYACGPLGYREAGLVLQGLGVDLKLDPFSYALPAMDMNGNGGMNNGGGNQGTPSAAQKAYAAAKSSFGVADYQNRNPEATQLGTAQLAKMGDLFIEAAPEVLTKFATSSRCAGVALTDSSAHFTREGLSCIGGEIIGDDQVTLASQLQDRAIGQGMSVTGAQELVVAGFLSAQFTCR